MVVMSLGPPFVMYFASFLTRRPGASGGGLSSNVLPKTTRLHSVLYPPRPGWPREVEQCGRRARGQAKDVASEA